MTFSMTRAPQIQDQILLILLQVSRTLGEFRIVIGGLFHNLNSSSCVASSSSFFFFEEPYLYIKGNMVQIRVQLRRTWYCTTVPVPIRTGPHKRRKN